MPRRRRWEQTFVSPVQRRNCTKRGLACDNGMQLKWEQEFASRGLAFGRQGRWTKNQNNSINGSTSTLTPLSTMTAEEAHWCAVPFVGAHHFINTLYSELAETMQPRSDQHTEAEDYDRAVVVQQYPLLAGKDNNLFEYYLQHLCPLTTPSRRFVSPFAYLIVPLVSVPGHEDIFRALMALAARHRSVAGLDSPRWSKVAMTLRDGVIGSLRRRLASLAAAPDDTWDDQILIMMMFLCLYEIVDNCDHRWVIHLRASQDIIRRRQQVQKRHTLEFMGYETHLNALTAFTERFFAFQDVISRAACENAPLFGQEYWDEEDTRQLSLSSSLPSEVDSWMGCSTTLMQLLYRITDLGRLKAQRAIAATELEGKAAALEQELDLLQQNGCSEEIGHSDSGSSSDVSLIQVAELKRKAIVLYLHCVLYDATPVTPVASSLVTEILMGTARLVRSELMAGLSFPLFVAAVELDPLDDWIVGTASDKPMGVSGRRLVQEMLTAMANLSLSNIARTKDIIEKVWRMRDMSLDHDGSSRLPVTANDWGVFVGPYSSNISLA
ncbi:hypothetical protein SCUCBS95973_008385 [Sporothrix curviconia]|uniref:C6 zinc finger domain containing protein n=1 Tax=Sporothrix curviconia TaxID=1260050 RepID=A0ABP0CLW3_9PEZI